MYIDLAKKYKYHSKEVGTTVPIRLAPYASTILVFDGDIPDHVEHTDMHEIESVNQRSVHALASGNGIFHTTIKRNGQAVSKSLTVSDVPDAYTISGDWTLTLEAYDFPKYKKSLTRLESWTDDPKTRHFSGTGRYELSFELSESYVADDHMLQLDLGKVGNIADVQINGQDIGTIWMREQTLDVTSAIKAGTNRLVVQVTNTGINRVSGWDEPPPVPDELVGKYGHATSRRRPPELDFEPLPPSGLMGPVKISVFKKIKISIE